jgi:hypothetical protein
MHPYYLLLLQYVTQDKSGTVTEILGCLMTLLYTNTAENFKACNA